MFVFRSEELDLGMPVWPSVPIGVVLEARGFKLVEPTGRTAYPDPGSPRLEQALRLGFVRFASMELTDQSSSRTSDAITSGCC